MIDLIKTLPNISTEDLQYLREAIGAELLSRERNPDPSWRWNRCAACNGTGKHHGGYCTCSVGRDLRMVETGGCSYDAQRGGGV